jgi:Na+/H+ antiporter NhaD/arsenite permease-like protein
MLDILSNGLLKQFIAVAILLSMFISLLLRYKNPKNPVWAYMAFFSFIAVAFDLISIDQISSAVDIEVILFLVGMFSIVSIAESSGLLDLVAWRIMITSKSIYTLLIIYSMTIGLLSAVAVNDTMAVMGPPIAYSLSRITGIDLRILTLLLAYSITIGSVMTPIGNPQNMLIATESAIKAPLITFIKYLLIPTIINLLITPLLMIKLFKIENRRIEVGLVPQELIRDRRDAYVGALALIIVILLLFINDLMSLLGLYHIRYIGFIPFIVAAGAYLFTERPREIIKNVDWGTIIFFITMFITMKAVWDTGVLYKPLNVLAPLDSDNIFVRVFQITIVSIVFSQFLSNVPFTKIFIEYLKTFKDENFLTAQDWIALAMSSTIAGNLTLFGAASNIIILEALESRYGRTISSIDFVKLGILITAVNILVYTPFIVIIR